MNSVVTLLSVIALLLWSQPAVSRTLHNDPPKTGCREMQRGGCPLCGKTERKLDRKLLSQVQRQLDDPILTLVGEDSITALYMVNIAAKDRTSALEGLNTLHVNATTADWEAGSGDSVVVAITIPKVRVDRAEQMEREIESERDIKRERETESSEHAEVTEATGTPAAVTAGAQSPNNELPEWNDAPASAKPVQLEQNYPNPAITQTTIGYRLGKAEFVTLRLFDPAGHEIETLRNGYASEGYHSVTFDTYTLTPGTYRYMLQIGRLSVTRTLEVVR